MFSAEESNCWIDPVLLWNMDSWEEGEGGALHSLGLVRKRKYAKGRGNCELVGGNRKG